MTTVPIPTPGQAHDLQALYAGHPIVGLAEAGLRAFGCETVEDAARLLPMWSHFRDLSDREAQAVLARFMPGTDDAVERAYIAAKHEAERRYHTALEAARQLRGGNDVRAAAIKAADDQLAADYAKAWRDAIEHGNSGPGGAL